MDPTKQVNNLINCLTNDEDKRQDLWVHYLSGHSPSSFVSHLNKISKELAVAVEMQQILLIPPSDKFYALLSRLSELEQSIACLLALGLTVGQISHYKGISEVRIRQVLEVMKYNSAWKELYGTKETTDRRRTLRLK